MLFAEMLLKGIHTARKDRKYKRLKGKPKRIVCYMFQELQNLVEKDHIPVNKYTHRVRKVHIFELKFHKYHGIVIYTFFKCGAARVKCFKDYLSEDYEMVIEAVEFFFKSLKCEVEIEPYTKYQQERKLNVYITIQEDGTL